MFRHSESALLLNGAGLWLASCALASCAGTRDPAIYAGDIVIVDGSRIKAIQRQVLEILPLAGLFAPILR